MRSSDGRPLVALLLLALFVMSGGAPLAQGGGDVIPPASPATATAGKTAKPAARAPSLTPGP